MDNENQESYAGPSGTPEGQPRGETAKQAPASAGEHHHDGHHHHHHHHHDYHDYHNENHRNLKEGELYLGSDGHYHHYHKHRNRGDQTERYKYSALRHAHLRRVAANVLFTVMIILAVLVIIAVAIVAFFPVF